MIDPFELHWPNMGLVEWEDLETGRSLLVDSSDARVRQVLEKQYERKRQEMAGLLRRHSVDTVSLEVGADPVEPLLAFFKLRERRKARG